MSVFVDGAYICLRGTGEPLDLWAGAVTEADRELIREVLTRAVAASHERAKRDHSAVLDQLERIMHDRCA